MVFTQFHWGDWVRSTQDLTPLERGIYIDLLQRYYQKERPITDEECKRIARAYANAEQEAMQYVLQTFFEREEGCWRHERCDTEIAKANAVSEKRVSAAKKSWANRGSKKSDTPSAAADVGLGSVQMQCERNTNAEQVQSNCNASALLTINHKPITNNQIKETTTVVVVGENSPIEEVTATPSRTACADAPTAPAAESLFEDEGPYTPPKRAIPPCPAQKIVDLYHKHLPMGRRVQVLDPKRKSAIAARWRQVFTTNGYTTTEQGLKLFDEFFEQCATKRFLRGECPPSPGREVPFQVSIDYLMRPGEFRDIFEGKYY